ncbi:MAG: HAMP domain-containing protein [Anaerolineae bacterium]|jgi:NarL family two-component system sensor histidine kinase LiaS|nr:HAMP domain-containing protein [Anaerolineae bacterium]
MRQRIRAALKSLQTRLTLTYTLVTVSALLALEIIVLGGLMGVAITTQFDETILLTSMELEFAPQASDYLQRHDLEGLQKWMTEIYESKNASEFYVFASSQPFVIFDLDGMVVAQTPFEREAIGQAYAPPDEIDPTWFADRAIKGEFDPDDKYQQMADGSWYLLAPVQKYMDEKVWGTMALNVIPASRSSKYLSLFGGIVGVTAVALLIGVTPFGMLFGYMMSRNMVRRLMNLETVADAYSRGDFTVGPQDGSQDEIGRLGDRLKQMAQQIKTLLQSRQELATLKERNWLARELHDTVKQQHFAALMQVRAARNLAQQGVDAGVALGHLETAENLLKQSQQDLKGVIEELRPAQLDGHNLPAALRQFVQNWTAQNSITVDLAVQGERPLSPTIEHTLYRVVQEAFANIARHSTASHVDVLLHYTPHAVSLSITDNGQGFDPQKVQRGFGLSTMRQRVTEANGQLTLTSERGQGTKVMAKIDINI